MRAVSSRSPPAADVGLCASSARAIDKHAKKLRRSGGAVRKLLAIRDEFAYFGSAQFRTCLWPCVDRWASGQEAGQPPKEVISLPCSCDRQPEANRCTPLSTGDAA